jgi:P-loop containing dynein motor region D4
MLQQKTQGKWSYFVTDNFLFISFLMKIFIGLRSNLFVIYSIIIFVLNYLEFDHDTFYRLYRDMGGYNGVRTIFSSVLEEYGTQKKKMTLVLFEAALEHLCRIHRIIRNPRGREM